MISTEIVTIWNALGISALLAALIGGYTNHYLNKRKQKRKLRKAFKAEINSVSSEIDDVIKGFEEKDEESYIKNDFFPTSVYDNNCSQLGLLSGEEVENIVGYYSSLKNAKKLIKNSENFEEDKLNKAQEAWFKDVRDLKNAAVNSINKNL